MSATDAPGKDTPTPKAKGAPGKDTPKGAGDNAGMGGLYALMDRYIDGDPRHSLSCTRLWGLVCAVF
ncbi:MAG: hypothetical protein JKY37_08500 [Nannocystaceae bacterium]|nr:hypothetical protein [Nannocystaceae bacterium]